MSKSNTDLFQNAIELYLTWLELDKGLSKHTVSNYQSDITQFLKFISQKKLKSWDTVQSSHFDNWLSELGSRQLANKASRESLPQFVLLANGFFQKEL